MPLPMPDAETAPPAPCRIVVNGRPAETRATTLQALLAEREIDGPFVGTAVNGELVRRAERGAHPIADGDRIEILTPMQGG